MLPRFDLAPGLEVFTLNGSPYRAEYFYFIFTSGKRVPYQKAL